MNFSIAATIVGLAFAAALATQPTPKPAFLLTDIRPSISPTEMTILMKTELPEIKADGI